MEFDLETGKELVDELLNLWEECKKRCDRIEEIIQEINLNVKDKEAFI